MVTLAADRKSWNTFVFAPTVRTSYAGAKAAGRMPDGPSVVGIVKEHRRESGDVSLREANAKVDGE